MIAAVEILAAPTGGKAVQAAQPFPPFCTPFIEPHATPLQLQGDTSPGTAAITLTDSGLADDQLNGLTVDQNQAIPLFAPMFIDPNRASLHLLGDSSGITPVTLGETTSSVDTISVLITDGYQAVPLPFPPFSAPFIEPNVTPLQLQGDASGSASIGLTDSGTADDSSITISAAVPLTDSGVGADTISISAA